MQMVDSKNSMRIDKNDFNVIELKKAELSKEILVMIKNSLLVQYPFLESAIGQLKEYSLPSIHSLATDGRYLFYSPDFLFDCFSINRKKIEKIYLHVILHCLLRHSFVGSYVDARYWNLATDFVVRKILMELMPTAFSEEKIEGYKERLKEIENLSPFTAQKLYEYFCNHHLSEQEFSAFWKLTAMDWHLFWYPSKTNNTEQTESDMESEESLNDERIQTSFESDERKKSGSDIASNNEKLEQKTDGNQENSITDEIYKREEQHNNEMSTDLSGGKEQQKELGQTEQDGKNENPLSEETVNTKEEETYTNSSMEAMNKENDSFLGKQNVNGIDFIENKKLDQEIWEKIGRQCKLTLNHFSKNWGEKAGSLMENMIRVRDKKTDYKTLLSRFAVSGEKLKVDEDEFDYIYYSYGLNKYNRMPFIEPLEYKNGKSIKEFVIALDTSGSCKGDLIYQFIETTYHILKEQENFFHNVNIHIIQCDAKIQSDFKIKSETDLKRFFREEKIRGFGGTDFRPVFTYVEDLINKREIKNLNGLLYFTDGYGIFPTKKPSFKTAMVSYMDTFSELQLPSWVIPILLNDQEGYIQ